ncbi:Uncharacterised protein [Mycolicibacterium vanbaalenii]|uniref:Peptidase S9 prolyl oligopeptidase catalytic domain-containing protein n=1 Tax=Mycolicibacterium vanbaalenii TaxID=110539 RepID=A0A5S9QPG5_MYCVN|nr:prolyl oligopeptidase family serine peptidase [Mycolicibacterium vanbaalenii]CAA0120143.1 Uncharacterised protein [Mycolicibacterium vanbaalenii]
MGSVEKGDIVAQRMNPKSRLFFMDPEDEDLDFIFQWFVGWIAYGAGTPGELFKVARKIDPKSAVSWTTEFGNEAKKNEAIAEACLEKGHRISAGQTFLRAFAYYRAAYCAIDPADESFFPVYFKTVHCFTKYLDAMSKQLPHEYVEIEYKGYKFPGVFLKAENSSKPKPTIFFHNGGESHKEDTFFLGGKDAVERGYNALLIDLPYDVQPRSYNPEITAKNFPKTDLLGAYHAVTDFLVARPDVDAKRLVVSGDSYGGLKSTLNAANDDRFAALVASPPVYSWPLAIKNGVMPRQFVMGDAEDSKRAVNSLPWLPRTTLHRVCWMHGFDSLTEWLPAAENNMELDPRDITCAFLSIYAKAEGPELVRQATECYEKASSKNKSLWIGKAEDGADFHCQINNLSLRFQVEFDFLDEALDYNGY